MSRKPKWIKATVPGEDEGLAEVEKVLGDLGLNTVCREADCPNQGECWRDGTATFMLLGKVCTRNCRFCDVESGDPGGELDEGEPGRLKKAVRELGLDYVVLTSVDRDDLSDGGAEVFRAAIGRLKEISGTPLVEALIPDFSADPSALEKIATSGVDVVGHNLETVERLTGRVRDHRAGYDLSLSVLETVKELDPELVTRSSIMVGVGEEKGEVVEALEDLRRVGVDIVTIGQYLRPTEDQLPVERFWEVAEFKEVSKIGEEMGFCVVSGPFVRSSYKARETYLRAVER